MARLGTYPITFEDRKSISISDLRKWGYLQPDSWRSGTLSWSRCGTVHSQISFCVNMVSRGLYLQLSYSCQGQSICYEVQLTALTSNLRTGKVWYFVCPLTGKRCRKLYFKSGYFQYRGEGYYEKQIQSKYYRHLEKIYGPALRVDQVYSQLDKQYFKKFYKGKPTKKFAKLVTLLKIANNVSGKDLIAEFTRYPNNNST